MAKILTEIEGCIIYTDGENKVWFTAKAAIDDDGSDNRAKDPCWQRETSLKHKDKYIDAETVPYIAVPPAILIGIPGIVLGSKVLVSYKDKSVEAVVADIGPHKKLGEISMACARALGIDPSPTHGGIDEHVIHYEIFAGIPAEVNGETYELQPYHHG